MKLSDRTCKYAAAQEKAYKLADGHGLYLHVTPAGGKLWRFKFYFGGRERVLSFGAYPLITLAEAREKRDIARKQVAEGIDPGVLKQEEKLKAKVASENTFEALARAWHSQNKERWQSEAYGKNVLHRLEMDIFPDLGKIQVTAIKPLMVLGVIKKIENRGAHDIARRLLRNCQQIFSFCIIHGHIEHNPAADLVQALKPYKKGHYRAMEFKDLPGFFDALDSNKARLFGHTKLAIQLMLLTFVRTGELIKAKWEEFDLDNALWEIPAHRMKMRRPHIVPLSRQAVEVLQELKAMAGNREYVFPNRVYPRKHMSNNTILKALELMGYKDKTTGHGFRAFAMTTILEKLKYRFEVIDRQLAHIPANKVRAAYDRAQFLEERTVMMQDWANFLDRVRIGENNNVISFKKANSA